MSLILIIATEKKNTQPQPDYVEENFNCTFLNTGENNDNQKNKDSRMILNNYLTQSCNKVPKRTIIQQQSEYDVEKSDNFNVISNRSRKSEFKNHKKGGKIIKIVQKKEANEFFYQNKRSKPLLSPCPLNKKEEKSKALTSKKPTLKSRRFYRTQKNEKNNEEKKENRTLSKRKRNELEDYNIEKLIEIGDNNSNKYKNILSFGRKINSIKNKNSNNNENNLTFDTIVNKPSIKKKLNELGNKKGYLNNKKKIRKSNINNAINKSKDKKYIIKKIINRVKGLPLLKTTQTYGNIYDISNFKRNENENFSESERKKKNINPDITDNNNIIKVEINNLIDKPNIRGRNYCFQKKEYTLCNDISTPRINFTQKKEETKSNENKQKLQNNFKNLNNYIEKKRFSNTITSMGNTTRNDLTKKILSPQDQNILYKSNKNIMQTINPTNKKIYDENNNRAKNIKTCLPIKKSNGIIKTYYGYDERHTLEGSINNHTTYVSVYSRKIINHNNNSIDRQNIKEK